MGVPVIEATSEAKAQCAALCNDDKVYAVASKDRDSLTFWCSKRHLMYPSSKKIPIIIFEVSKVFFISSISISVAILTDPICFLLRSQWSSPSYQQSNQRDQPPAYFKSEPPTYPFATQSPCPLQATLVVIVSCQ